MIARFFSKSKHDEGVYVPGSGASKLTKISLNRQISYKHTCNHEKFMINHKCFSENRILIEEIKQFLDEIVIHYSATI